MAADPSESVRGNPFGKPFSVTIDISDRVGRVLPGQGHVGTWSSSETLMLINVLELEAVLSRGARQGSSSILEQLICSGLLQQAV